MWEVRACRVCLCRDGRIDPPEKHRLHRAYETVAGLPLAEECGMPQWLCTECAHTLRKYSAFRSKCRRAAALLRAIHDAQQQITDEEIAKVDRRACVLASPLAVCRLEPQNVDPDCELKPESAEGQFASELLVKKEEEEVVEAFSPLPEPPDSDSGSLKDEPLINYRSARKETKEKKPKERKTKTAKSKTKRKPDKIEVTIDPEPVPSDNKPAGKLKKHLHYPQSYYEEFATITTLTREQQLEEIERRRDTPNYKNSPLKCTLCYKGFIEQAAFRNHMQRHDPASGEYECDICRRRFRLLRILNKHIAGNHSRRYTCKICQHVCTNPCQARLHDKWHKGTCYQCPLCDDSFLKFTSYMGHLRKKHPSQFVCEVCGNAFVSEKGIILHKNLTHKPEEMTLDGPYCSECNVRFASEEAFKKHLVSSAKHNLTNDCLHGCDDCGLTFETRMELRTHLLSAHGRTARALRPQRPRASRALPVGSWPRPCELCPVEVNSGRAYWQHFRRAHKDQNYPKAPSAYTCEVCGRGFKVRALLRYHQRKHTGDKPYRCEFCPKRFTMKTYLDGHRLMHTGERPFPCNVCNKAFQTKGNLNKHYMIHTGVKEHECEYCKKMFRVPSEMQFHLDHVHLKKPWPKRVRNRRAAPAPAAPAPPP